MKQFKCTSHWTEPQSGKTSKVLLFVYADDATAARISACACLPEMFEENMKVVRSRVMKKEQNEVPANAG